MFTLRSWPGHPSSWATFILPSFTPLSRNRPKNINNQNYFKSLLYFFHFHTSTMKPIKKKERRGKVGILLTTLTFFYYYFNYHHQAHRKKRLILEVGVAGRSIEVI